MTSLDKFRKVPKKYLVLISLCLISPLITAQEQSWVDIAVHNFGAPINTMWAEGELSFADDGTMVYCSARQDMAVAEGDPKDLYIATLWRMYCTTASNVQYFTVAGVNYIHG